MSYNIELSANFKKEAKRLTKKSPSLKQELATLFTELEINPTMERRLATAFIKYALPSLLKIKVNRAVQECYHL